MHFPTVNPDSSEKCIEYIFHYCFQKSSEKCIGSPNPLFYRCKFSHRLQIRLLVRKTAARIAATDQYWRLPSSPIVENKHVVSLCKLKSVLIYTWVAKPFILPLQIFDTHEISIQNRKTAARMRASEQYWRLPSSPIVKNKTGGFLM